MNECCWYFQLTESILYAFFCQVDPNQDSFSVPLYPSHDPLTFSAKSNPSFSRICCNFWWYSLNLVAMTIETIYYICILFWKKKLCQSKRIKKTFRQPNLCRLRRYSQSYINFFLKHGRFCPYHNLIEEKNISRKSLFSEKKKYLKKATE